MIDHSVRGQRSSRLLSRREAADYCALSVQGFSRWVKQGKLPKALNGTIRWDLKALDRALDSLSGLQISETFPLDDWRSKRARRSEGNS
jgi:predicted DNA-binding transcriptional regulator AlpA